MIKKWWMRLVTGPYSASKVETGTRVEYQGNEGTIVGGTLHVKFDKQPKFMRKVSHQPGNTTSSFNLDKSNIKVI